MIWRLSRFAVMILRSVFFGVFVLLTAVGCEQPGVAFDPANALESKVSGEKALAHVGALVGFGARPAGSDAIEESRQYIEQKLTEAGWSVSRQSFKDSTPEGEIEFVNLRARFGAADWDENMAGLLCSHYDTKPFDAFEFVGANDGGSSTGLLIELARVLSERPEAASRIELVFFDGEEAFGPNITPTDGLYGSRFYAKQWLTEKASSRPKWGVLLDMVGDRSLKIRAGVRIPGASLRDLASSAESGYVVDAKSVEASLNQMSRNLLSAAKDLGFQSEVGISPDYIVDDHVPLNVSAGIPTIDLIDFDYPYWHTPGDTLDKISPESMEITGRVAILLVEKYLLP